MVERFNTYSQTQQDTMSAYMSRMSIRPQGDGASGYGGVQYDSFGNIVRPSYYPDDTPGGYESNAAYSQQNYYYPGIAPLQSGATGAQQYHTYGTAHTGQAYHHTGQYYASYNPTQYQTYQYLRSSQSSLYSNQDYRSSQSSMQAPQNPSTQYTSKFGGQDSQNYQQMPGQGYGTGQNPNRVDTQSQYQQQYYGYNQMDAYQYYQYYQQQAYYLATLQAQSHNYYYHYQTAQAHYSNQHLPYPQQYTTNQVPDNTYSQYVHEQQFNFRLNHIVYQLNSVCLGSELSIYSQALVNPYTMAAETKPLNSNDKKHRGQRHVYSVKTGNHIEVTEQPVQIIGLHDRDSLAKGQPANCSEGESCNTYPGLRSSSASHRTNRSLQSAITLIKAQLASYSSTYLPRDTPERRFK